MTTQFKVTYRVEAGRQFLPQHGLKRMRPKEVPGKAPSEETQRACVRRYEVMPGAYAPGPVFLFLEAMPRGHQHAPGACGGDPKDPPIIQTKSGRKRLNILGGYPPAHDSWIQGTGEETCTAKRGLELFERMAIQHTAAPSIVLFADHAKDFKAKMVTEWLAAHPQGHLELLPPYAPNVTRMERFWKCAKAHLVKNPYYEKDHTFRAHGFRLLNHVDQSVEELKTLMVENFQIIQPKAA
jgi:hypothetical protein